MEHRLQRNKQTKKKQLVRIMQECCCNINEKVALKSNVKHTGAAEARRARQGCSRTTFMLAASPNATDVTFTKMHELKPNEIKEFG